MKIKEQIKNRGKIKYVFFRENKERGKNKEQIFN